MTDSAETKKTNDANVWVAIMPFVAFALPFVANMLLGARFSPILGPDSIDDVSVNSYRYLVIAQVIVAAAICGYFWKTYLKEFPFRVDFWAIVVGVGGFFLWIGICALQIEPTLFQTIGISSWFPERVGFNPFVQITDDNKRLVFMIFRFTLLAAMIPILEELFLRGWLVRWCENPDEWQSVRLSEVGKHGIAGVAIYAVATHPGEAIAAIVWFTLVSWLMIKTGKFWNCVVAHAITNLMLGIYVCQYGQWHLW